MAFCSGLPSSASRWSQETCEELEKLRTPVDNIDCGYLGENRISGKGALIVDAFVANAIKKNYDTLIFQSHSFGARVVQKMYTPTATHEIQLPLLCGKNVANTNPLLILYFLL